MPYEIPPVKVFTEFPFSIDITPLTTVADEKVTGPVPERVRLLNVNPGVTETVPPIKFTVLPVLVTNVPPVLVRFPPKLKVLVLALKVPVFVKFPATEIVPALAVTVPLLVNVPLAVRELVPVASIVSEAPEPTVILLHNAGVPE